MVSYSEAMKVTRETSGPVIHEEGKLTIKQYQKCTSKHCKKCKHGNLSILGSGFKNEIPITIHVAVGTDIVHQHKSTDGATIGELSYRDFKIFCNQLKDLGDGGVVLNIGSAVVLPEVFLKALTIVRNLGYKTHNFIAANFDMIQHYRPRENVLNRPTRTGGKSYQFIGHHELMIPLFIAGIIEDFDQEVS